MFIQVIHIMLIINDIHFDQHFHLDAKCNISAQVVFIILDNDNFIFECIQNNNNVNIQVSVPTSFDKFSKLCICWPYSMSCLSWV